MEANNPAADRRQEPNAEGVVVVGNAPSSEEDERPTDPPVVPAGTAETAAVAGGGNEDGDDNDGRVQQRRQEEEERERLASETHNAAVAKRMGATTSLKDPKEAQRRLMRDLRSLQQTLASKEGESIGLSAHPVDGDIFHWRAVIAGPDSSAWEGGLFKLDLQFNDRYPLEPPHVRFLTKNVFHPNVYVDGNICLDTLKSSWSPTLDVEGLLLSITSLLSDPNPASAANGEAAKLLTTNRPLYEERVRKVVEDSLEQSFSDIEGDGES